MVIVINLFTNRDDSPSTPRKINMVHLQISHLERKMIWTKPPTSGVGGMILQEYRFINMNHPQFQPIDPWTLTCRALRSKISMALPLQAPWEAVMIYSLTHYIYTS